MTALVALAVTRPVPAALGGSGSPEAVAPATPHAPAAVTTAPTSRAGPQLAAPPAAVVPPPPTDAFAPSDDVLIDVPVQRQLPELPNGCEVTSLSMLLDAAGVDVDKLTLADAQDDDPTPPVYATGSRDFYEIVQWGNPNVAFVGNVRGRGGLGIYHAPLARLAATRAPGRVRDLTGSGFATIIETVRAGNPVLAWTTVDKTPVTRWATWQTPQGSFTGTRQEHAVLIVGVDAQGLIINDPLSGRRETVAVPPFVASWQDLGRQALTLRPPHHGHAQP